ncbi:MAG: TlpA family protein disulfide reductase [Polyangiaceae bacterium]|nr:TlpA family protein disulfide reductase [Polyangiaceae bacterium]
MVLSLGIAACAPAAPEGETPTASPLASAGEAPASGDAVVFQWPNVTGGGQISNADLAGRVSVLVFVTTYDVPSQAQVRFLTQLSRDHVPRLNVVAVVLEPPEHQPMAAAYASTLDLKYPVVMADAATIRGEGPFAGLHHVPAVAILDRQGRERFRNLGLMDQAALEAAVVKVEEETGVKQGVPEPASSATK